MDETEDYIGGALWMIVYVCIISATVFGNVLTIVAILLSRQLSALTSNLFILSLAVSDLFVGISIPYHMFFYLSETVGNEKYICIVRFVLISFACSSAIIKLMMVATDRYVAVMYPLHYNAFITARISFVMVCVGWVVSLLISTVPIYWNNWHQGVQCEPARILPERYFNFVLTPLFALVWLSMIGVYTKIWRETHQQVRRIRSAIGAEENKNSTVNDKRSIQVVMMTLGCFSVCWLPYFIVINYYRITGTSSKFSLFYEIAFTMAVGNSGMNPIIYAWKNSNFRRAFWCLLRCKSPNNATNSKTFITNHVPCRNGSRADVKASSIELDVGNCNECEERECSVATETSNVNSVNSLPRT